MREKDLYRAITKGAKGASQTIQVLTDLSQSARHYAMIEDYSLWPEDDHYGKSFESILDELKLFRVSQCYPVLLNAIQMFEEPAKIAETFRAIANFSFRYNIIGNETSGSLERIFAGIAYNIRTGTHASPRDVADALRGVNPDAKFRDDFQASIITKSRAAKLARYILAKINNCIGGGEAIPNPDVKEVNLEHILPQKPGPAWISSFSPGVDFSDYIWRIGNLTLLKTKYNLDAANASFQDKQRLAFSRSTLPLNDYLKQVTKWSDVEIENRQDEMAKIALQVWKL